MTQGKLTTQVKDCNIITQQVQNNREKSIALKADKDKNIVTKLTIGTVTLDNIMLITLQSKQIDKPREDATAPIINIKLKPLRARQYVNKGKEI